MAEAVCPKCGGIRKVVDPKKRQVVDCARCKGRGRIKVATMRV